uniref:Uncharacterized protein n=1 Tax=Populus trichocarpa TaxID=3694 RepID=A0A2K1X082_POPTR
MASAQYFWAFTVKMHIHWTLYMCIRSHIRAISHLTTYHSLFSMFGSFEALILTYKLINFQPHFLMVC